MAEPMLSPALAPPAAPQRIGGLLAAAQPGDPNARWTAGVFTFYESQPGWQLLMDCTDAKYDHGSPDDPRPTAGRPVLIQTSVTGPRPEIAQMEERARTRLEAVTSRALARELWAGDLTRQEPYALHQRMNWANPELGDGYVNPHLASETGEVLAPAVSVIEAVAAVEQAVAERLLLGAPHVHVPLVALASLQDYLVQLGDLLLTRAGSVVVADPGYPADGAPRIYGSGPVAAWWSTEIDTYAEPAEVVDVRTNRIEVVAERPGLVMFDPATLVSCQVQTGG